MDPKTLPNDLQSLMEQMTKLGWAPKQFGKGKDKYPVEYSNGTFYLNLEKKRSARIHVEYEDYWE